MLREISRQQIIKHILNSCDDSIGIGNDEFIKEILLTSKRFKSKGRIFDSIKFAGLTIEKRG